MKIICICLVLISNIVISQNLLNKNINSPLIINFDDLNFSNKKSKKLKMNVKQSFAGYNYLFTDYIESINTKTEIIFDFNRHKFSLGPTFSLYNDSSKNKFGSIANYYFCITNNNQLYIYAKYSFIYYYIIKEKQEKVDGYYYHFINVYTDLFGFEVDRALSDRFLISFDASIGLIKKNTNPIITFGFGIIYKFRKKTKSNEDINANSKNLLY